MLLTIVEPWWSEETASTLGGVAGAAVGVGGGLLGAAVGIFAPRGRGKALLLPLCTLILVAGAATFVAGIVAVGSGQPYSVYYPLLMVGSLLVLLLGCSFPVMLMAYQMAEARQRDAGFGSTAAVEVGAGRSPTVMHLLVDLWGPEGRYRRALRPWILGLLSLGGLGVLCGLVLLFLQSRFEVWFPVLLIGAEPLIGGLALFAMAASLSGAARNVQQTLERQRMEAEALRRS